VRETIRLADGGVAQTYIYALPFSGLMLCGAEWVK
jgi:hypothetical protein